MPPFISIYKQAKEYSRSRNIPLPLMLSKESQVHIGERSVKKHFQGFTLKKLPSKTPGEGI
jgi:hypothetical protein